MADTGEGVDAVAGVDEDGVVDAAWLVCGGAVVAGIMEGSWTGWDAEEGVSGGTEEDGSEERALKAGGGGRGGMSNCGSATAAAEPAGPAFTAESGCIALYSLSLARFNYAEGGMNVRERWFVVLEQCCQEGMLFGCDWVHERDGGWKQAEIGGRWLVDLLARRDRGAGLD